MVFQKSYINTDYRDPAFIVNGEESVTLSCGERRDMRNSRAASQMFTTPKPIKPTTGNPVLSMMKAPGNQCFSSPDA